MTKLKKAMIAPLVGAVLCGSVLCFTPKTDGGISYAAPASYESLVNVSSQGSGLRIEPSVVFEVKDEAGLAAIAELRPTTVLLSVDDSLNVTLEGGTLPFQSVFHDYIKGVSIPALRIETMRAALAFQSFMKNTCYISDIMVVSSSLRILQAIYEDDVTYIANGVYDVSGVKISANRYDFWDHIADANRVGANILLINGEDENASVAATYAAALNKVCWGAVSGEVQAIGAVAAGCYGLVGEKAGELQSAIKRFSASGFAQPQSVAAHRGITAYANENSLTACAASANEGATHIEVDVQVTGDGEIVLCHNSDAGHTSTAGAQTWFATHTAEELRKATLYDYDANYGETFPTLDEFIQTLIDTDVIMIVELKLDGASDLALSKKPIEKIYEIFSSYGEKMEGRWITITFFGSYAKLMRQVCPEIPVCCLGFGAETGSTVKWEDPPASSVGSVADYIKFNRKGNFGLDHCVSAATYSTVYQYAVRGYLQNTWTYETTEHVDYGVNIATTNAAEEMAMEVKDVGVGEISLTAEELEAGTVTLPCRTYNGFVKEQTCNLVYLDGEAVSGNTVRAVFYYGKNSYGVYSNMIQVKVK